MRWLQGAAVGDDCDDFRNDVTSTAHDDGITDAYIQAGDLVSVMQGGAGNGDSSDLYGGQACDWGGRTGAANLDFNGFDSGGLFLGRKFMGNGPTGARATNPISCWPDRSSSL